MDSVPGSTDLYNWFGYWPSFHDAEVLSLELKRGDVSRLVIHTWEMTSRVEAGGQYALDKHIQVEFLLSGILELELDDFNEQNVISGLSIVREQNTFMLRLHPCYGLCGTIKANYLEIRVQPGAPAN